jgi:hypothetical protein
MFVLDTAVTNLPAILSSGSKVDILDSSPSVIGEYTADGASNTTTIYVNETIDLDGVDELEFFPQYPIVKQFTRYTLESSGTPTPDLFSDFNDASNTDYDYDPIYGSSVNVDPWSVTIPSTFIAQLEGEVAAINQGLTAILPAEINLGNEAFVRFVELFGIYNRYVSNPFENDPISDDQDKELKTLLRTSIKNKVIATGEWGIEENGPSGLLNAVQVIYPNILRLQDPRLFQISSYSPQIAKFDESLYNNTDLPYLNGQFPLLSKTPNSHAGHLSRQLLTYRESEFTGMASRFGEYFDSEGPDALITSIWGGLINSTVGAFFDFLYNALYNIDPVVVANANKLLIDLHMSQEEFESLRELRNEWSQKQQLPEAVTIKEKILEILTTSYRKANSNSFWKTSETSTYTSIYGSFNIYEYWRVSQENLVPWLCTASLRKEWISAIYDRLTYVAVDPDVIDIKYITDITSAALTPSLRAFTLLNSRTTEIDTWIADAIADLPGGLTDEETFNWYVAHFLEISSDELDWIFEALSIGEDISYRLNQLYCSPSQIYSFSKIKTAIENSIPFADLEEQLLNTLAIIKKLRTYCEWRDVEVLPISGQEVINIGPIFFKEPVDEYGTEQNPNSTDKWRFSPDLLQSWKRLFKARKLIWESLEANISEMNSDADDETMMMLRDAYIEKLINPASSVTKEERAEELSRVLFQDFSVECCGSTTHLSTAISSIQQIFAVLNEETNATRYPILDDWSLDAPYFDKEWKWLGSYGSFRSAMFVYIYPENLLHPALMKTQSSKFATINKRLNQGGVFTPETACEIAHEFRDYLSEVSALEPEVSSNVRVMRAKGTCDETEQSKYKNAFYGFAKSNVTNKVYYTYHDAELDSGITLNWQEMPQFENHVTRLIGATAGKKASGKRNLYVFAQLRIEAKTSIGYVKYDLDERIWDEEYSELEFSEGIDFNSITMLQRYDETNPGFFFVKKSATRTLYYNMLNIYKDSWNWSSDILMSTSKLMNDMQPVAALEVGQRTSSAYNMSNVAVVYKINEKDNYILQPFSQADPSKHFKYFNRTRPGKYYAIASWGNASTIGLTNLLYGSTIESGFYADIKFQGIYGNYSDPDYFGIRMLHSNGSSYIMKLKFARIDNAEEIQLSNADRLREYFGYYFGIDIDLIRVNLSMPIIGYHEQRSLYAIQKGVSEHFAQKVKLPVNNAPSYYSFATIQSILLQSKAVLYKKAGELIHTVTRDAVATFVANALNEKDKDPSWYYMERYLKAFTDYLPPGATSSSSNPNQNAGSRPNLLRVLTPSKGKLGLPTFATTIVDEYRIEHVELRAVNSNVNQEVRTSFLPIDNNFALGATKNGSVAFEYNTSLFSSSSFIQDQKLTPFSTNLPAITSNKNSNEFQLRRVVMQAIFEANDSETNYIGLLSEAYHSLPILFGLKLQAGGYFQEALYWYRSVYDYKWANENERKIWYGLVAEEAVNNNYSYASDWLIDPMNPHQIALTRAEAYTSYIIQNITKCLLDYGNQQFTIDTVESIPVATKLYEEVEYLMGMSLFAPSDSSCSCGDDAGDEIIQKIRCLDNIHILLKQQQAIEELGYLLEQVPSCAARTTLLDAIINPATPLYYFGAATNQVELNDILSKFKKAIITAIGTPSTTSLSTFLTTANANASIYADNVLSVNGYNSIAERVSYASINDLNSTYQRVTGYNSSELRTSAVLGFTSKNRDTSSSYTQGESVFASERIVSFGGNSSSLSLINASYEEMPLISTRNGTDYQYEFSVFPQVYDYCIPDNPTYEAYRLQAELNLYKIRHCMNIAGMKRTLDPYAAPTDATTGLPSIGAGGKLSVPGQLVIKPTQYRYPVLIQRAKELVQQAAQLESVYLSSLEKKDAETYTKLKAKQDLKLSKAGVKLNDYKVRVSEGEVDLAKLQQDRYEIQVEQLDQMLQAGLNQFESQLIGTYQKISSLSEALAYLQGASALATATAGIIVNSTAATANTAAAAAATASVVGAAAAPGFTQNATNNTLAAIQSGIQAGFAIPVAILQASVAKSQGQASILSVMSSLENRQREWRFQKVLAEHDIKIASQQVSIAQDRLKVSGQELKMAEMQQTFAEDSLEFLQNKFTNAEMYTWMTQVLAGAFSHILNEATAMAKLAMYQIMFDRQQAPPLEISDNYWDAPSMEVSLEPTKGADRKGLTGSTRLLQDLVQMDQWAFTSDTRKLEVTKTISMARMFPMEFETFKQTGKITFNTLMDHFDRDFPGQYMRIIRRVATNMIALVPPTEGIKATLTSSGISEVVIKGSRFQSTYIRRSPETIALSTPTGNAGVLELQPMAQEFANPFEGNGVAMQWEFDMPIESNFLDYNSISDVLFTISYTAMENIDYKAEVMRKLPNEYEGERLYSLRNDFADEFYQLAHPEESDTPYKVNFNTLQFDFPGNLKEYYIRGIRVMLSGYSRKLDDELITKELPINYLPYESNEPIVGQAVLGKNNFAGTLGQGGAGLQKFIGQKINGVWTMDFSLLNMAVGGNSTNYNSPLGFKRLLESGEIADVLFVIDFGANYRNA